LDASETKKMFKKIESKEAMPSRQTINADFYFLICVIAIIQENKIVELIKIFFLMRIIAQKIDANFHY